MDRIFNRFSTVLQNAVDALAPPVPLLDDFIYHWKMLMKFYTNQKTTGIAKTSIESTNIPGHLDQLLKLLLEEESSVHGEPTTTGPCLEYLLQHHLLDLLATLACTDCPPGMKHYTLNFVQRLITQTKQPILPHVGIYVPVQRLIGLCNGLAASPTEQTEIHFLCSLCALVCRDPHLTHVFNTCVDTTVPRVGVVDSSVGPSAAIVDTLAPRDDVLVSSADPSAAIVGTLASNANTLASSNDTLGSSDDVLASNADPSAAIIDTLALSDSSSEKAESRGDKFPLLDALLSYLTSADSRVMVKACEGVMVVASLPSDDLARVVAQRSDVCAVLASRLQATFLAIPSDVDPNDLDDVIVKWGLDAPLWSDETSFPGCRAVALFLAWLDYCDQLVREAHPILGSALALTLRLRFMKEVLEAALTTPNNLTAGDTGHDDQAAEDELTNEDIVRMVEHRMMNDTLVLVTALVTKCLRQTSAPALLTEFFTWLVGDGSDSDLCQQLLDNCCHDRDEVSLETLRLFEVMLDKPSNTVLERLVLRYVGGRDYYDTEAGEEVIASWSDEEDQRERVRGLDFSPGSSPISRTLAPSNIHKIINSWLFLVPQNLRSSTDPEESGYQQYVQDADRQYRACISRCGNNSWPLEAVGQSGGLVDTADQSDDSRSSDSRPEADHARQFDEGPFLNMLFSRLLRLPYQPYEINLQLTGLVSRLAMLPHGCLHEFLLNPALPVVDGTVTLFVTLEAVAAELATQIPQLDDYQRQLQVTRRKLLGDEPIADEESNGLLESLIVLEEFCKELAAIAFVKYHHSS